MTPVLATQGGPNFTTGPAPGTVFPLLQTTLVMDSAGIDADPEANAAGGTATIEGADLVVNLLHTHAALPGTHGFAGSVHPEWQGDPNLDWTRVGYWSTGGVWDYYEAPLRHSGVFVTGYETAAAAMPTTGSATYSGSAQGTLQTPYGGGICNCSQTFVRGDASFTANFGTRNLTGSLTNMTVEHPWDDSAARLAWMDVGFSSTIAGNGFSGTTWVTAAGNSHLPFGLNATGTLVGKFFGPSAEEAGAIWTLFDGTNSAIGTLTGRRN